MVIRNQNRVTKSNNAAQFFSGLKETIFVRTSKKDIALPAINERVLKIRNKIILVSEHKNNAFTNLSSSRRIGLIPVRYQVFKN